MTKTERKYISAAYLMFASAALHLPIAALAFGQYGLQMIVAALLWTLLGLGVMRYWRWCAYLAFLGLIFGVSAALAGGLGTTGFISALFWVIVGADLLAADLTPLAMIIESGTAKVA